MQFSFQYSRFINIQIVKFNIPWTGFK